MSGLDAILCRLCLYFCATEIKNRRKCGLQAGENGAPWFFCNTQGLLAPDIPLFSAPFDFEREEK